MSQAGEPVLKKRKQNRKSLNLETTLTGDNLNQNAEKLWHLEPENLAWLRSFHSSLRWVMTITWRREAVHVTPEKKDEREETLNEIDI